MVFALGSSIFLAKLASFGVGSQNLLKFIIPYLPSNVSNLATIFLLSLWFVKDKLYCALKALESVYFLGIFERGLGHAQIDNKYLWEK